MARPNRKTKVESTVSDDVVSVEATSTPTVTEVPKTPKVKMVSVYGVNRAEDEEHAEKRPWGPNTVNGTIISIVAALEESGQYATKEAILESFAADEKSARLVATEWVKTPMKYIEGYLHFLKGNRSLVSTKIEA